MFVRKGMLFAFHPGGIVALAKKGRRGPASGQKDFAAAPFFQQSKQIFLRKNAFLQGVAIP